MKLTVKQISFCNYYIETGNASEAYRRAYSADRMQDTTINRKAIELMENDKVAAYIKKLREELQQRSDIAKDEAVRELTNIVRNRITNVLSVKGRFVAVKGIENLPDNIVSGIQSVKETKNGIEIKLYDKIAAIDRLSKMLGWDTPQQINANVSYSEFEGWTDEQLEEYIREGFDEFNTKDNG